MNGDVNINGDIILHKPTEITNNDSLTIRAETNVQGNVDISGNLDISFNATSDKVITNISYFKDRLLEGGDLIKALHFYNNGVINVNSEEDFLKLQLMVQQIIY